MLSAGLGLLAALSLCYTEKQTSDSAVYRTADCSRMAALPG